MSQKAVAVMVGLVTLAVSMGLGASPGSARLRLTGASLDTVAAPCAEKDTGISLPPGFCATVFADNLGHVRHITVAPNGIVYANIWSGRYYPMGKPPADGFLVALKAPPGADKAKEVVRFGDTLADGSAGGTGIRVFNGAIYAEENDKIVRYALSNGAIGPKVKPEVVVSGLPLGGDHPMHPFVISKTGALFVDMGTATNSCQPQNRTANVPGANPCVESETRGGIWLYDANKRGQVFSSKERYATGIRNGEGLEFDSAGRLIATQHGRDQLLQNWRKFYPDPVKATELPAEELLLVSKGGDYGWPECYYDPFQKKLVLAPEYGGDGGTAVGACAQKLPPIAAFPAHWAPNDLTLYKAGAFPRAYWGGAFIAFHGSWNRAPAAQAGFNVVFQPLLDAQASGPYVVFADGFAGPDKASGKAIFRPMGLAVAPDGALFIADDVKGRIWRVTYHGSLGAPVASAPKSLEPPAAAAIAPPAAPAELKVPEGSTAAEVAAGAALFKGGSCSGCHGTDAAGSAVGPNLRSGTWLWGDGSLAAIKATVSQGVAAPKQYRSPMPPMGGQQLSPADLNAVSAYVWAVGHSPKT